MNRSVFAPALALLLCSTTAVSAFAQAQAAAPTPTAAPERAKFVAPLKGNGTIEVLKISSNRVAKEFVTKFKIKNTSSAPLAMLKIEEYWYDKAGKMVSYDERRNRQPLYPGEVVEMETRAPVDPNAFRSSFVFTHANGTLKATEVKAMK